MDEDQKHKFKVELEKRTNKLWEDFLDGMTKLGFESHVSCQQLEFRDTRFHKPDMRGRLILKVPPKDGKLQDPSQKI